MSSPDLADLPAYLRTIGLILETVEDEHFPFRLFRSDGQGSIERFKTAADVWRDIEIQAFALFRHVETARQVVEDLKIDAAERRALLVWFAEGGVLPAFVQERRAAFLKPFPGDRPVTWREDLRALMDLPATISPYAYMPSFIAVLAYALRRGFPDEARQWFNRSSNNSDGLENESAGVEPYSTTQT
ncbi:MAG: hypothetical protein ACTHOL_18505 [Luteibacter jiangsuensis]